MIKSTEIGQNWLSNGPLFSSFFPHFEKKQLIRHSISANRIASEKKTNEQNIETRSLKVITLKTHWLFPVTRRQAPVKKSNFGSINASYPSYNCPQAGIQGPGTEDCLYLNVYTRQVSDGPEWNTEVVQVNHTILNSSLETGILPADEWYPSFFHLLLLLLYSSTILHHAHVIPGVVVVVHLTPSDFEPSHGWKSSLTEGLPMAEAVHSYRSVTRRRSLRPAVNPSPISCWSAVVSQKES